MHLETGEGVHTGRAYRAGSLIAHVVTGKLDVRASERDRHRKRLDRKDILKKQGNDVTLWRVTKEERRLSEEFG